MNTVIQFRADEVDKELVKQLAASKGYSLSDYIRVSIGIAPPVVVSTSFLPAPAVSSVIFRAKILAKKLLINKNRGRLHG